MEFGRNLNLRKEILFVHSAGPQGPWEGSYYLLSYLRDRLGCRYYIRSPEMPSPDNPRYRDWKHQLERELDEMGEHVIAVGHSMGGSVLLKYFSEEHHKKIVDGLFIASAPCWGEEGWESDDFLMPEKLLTHAGIRNVYLYHSNDDEVVPVTHMLYNASRIRAAKVNTLDGHGHLFSDGFPELIQDIINLP